MKQNRKHNKAEKEIEDTQILVEFLVAHSLDFEDIENFSEKTIREARSWYSEAHRSR